jgi:hypothetical protein
MAMGPVGGENSNSGDAHRNSARFGRGVCQESDRNEVNFYLPEGKRLAALRRTQEFHPTREIEVGKLILCAACAFAGEFCP